MGNLDPINILQKATPEIVGKETARIIKSAKKEGGCIFNSGECIPRETPQENIEAMIKTAKKYGRD